MTGPCVTVIVPVYNGEPYLRRALESVLEQDYEPIELIVVDDGSDDRSSEIAAAFDSARYIRQPHLGPAAARNKGFEESRGELIAFLDADDVLPPWKVSVQARYLVDHPEVGYVLGRQRVMLKNFDAPTWLTRAPTWLTRDLVYGDLGGIPIVSAMMRRSVFTAVGGFDPTFVPAEDRDLLVRIRELGVEIAVIPEIVLYRRLHGENLSLRERPEKPRLLRSLRAKIDRERSGPASGERQL